jgi:hypothetical protein
MRVYYKGYDELAICRHNAEDYYHQTPFKSYGKDDEGDDDVKEGRDYAEEDELSVEDDQPWVATADMDTTCLQGMVDCSSTI